MNLTLSNNQQHALATALENYLNGLGMEHEDEDETELEAILSVLVLG